MTASEIQTEYERHGYVLIKNFVNDSELSSVQVVLERFHERWLKDNAGFYQERAINSAYITGSKYLGDDDRLILFRFIGSAKFSKILNAIIPKGAMFVGSQLFFDPFNPGQKNYWHRDIQYNTLSVEQQREFIKTGNPLHLRLALKPERGVELIPGTHRRWDTEEEFDVRMRQYGRNDYDDLPGGREINLQRGDLLLFSAAMIHRGLYGGDRFAFDLVFGDADAAVAAHFDEDCLPNSQQLADLECPEPFELTRRLKQQ